MKLDLNPAQLRAEQLLESVRQPIAKSEKLGIDNARSRAGIDELKRKNVREAMPFSKSKRKKDPKRLGRRLGQGKFRNRTAPLAEDHSGPIDEAPVK